MVKMPALAVSLLLTQVVCSETLPSSAEEVEEGITYQYPFSYENTDSFFAEDVDKDESKKVPSKDESPSAWQGTLGKGKLTVDVENTDFVSQCQAKWDKIKEKNKPEEKKKPRRKDDEDKKEKKDHNPRVSIKWSTEN
jgi:hypothetical protein